VEQGDPIPCINTGPFQSIHEEIIVAELSSLGPPIAAHGTSGRRIDRHLGAKIRVHFISWH